MVVRWVLYFDPTKSRSSVRTRLTRLHIWVGHAPQPA